MINGYTINAYLQFILLKYNYDIYITIRIYFLSTKSQPNLTFYKHWCRYANLEAKSAIFIFFTKGVKVPKQVFWL